MAALLLALITLNAAAGCTETTPRQMFVAVDGPATGADGSPAAPFPNLEAAVRAARPGDQINIGRGSFPISGAVRVTTPGLRISGDPSGGTVFDGSRLVEPNEVRSVGRTARVAYQPLGAEPGQGLGLADLPLATDARGKLTPAARRSGWACVTGPSTYATARPSGGDPVGCASGTPRRINGYFPDQVWVGDQALQQVLHLDQVGPGRFLVRRSAATDANPAPSQLVLETADLAAGPLRVGRSTGNFMVVAANEVTVEHLTIIRHSPAWPATTVTVEPGVRGTRLAGLRLAENAGVSLKVAGAWRGGGDLVTDTRLSQVEVRRPGWMAAAIGYTDDTAIRSSRFIGADPFDEFTDSPVRGAIKAAKNHRMLIENSTFADNRGHGLWLDQSNYEVTVARSRFLDNTDAALFFEISHGLTLVDNFIRAGTRDAAVRLAGSSGLRLVNNTILGGSSAVAVLTDARSRDYPPDGRPCSEHPARYGQPGDLAACAVVYPSDFDRTRPGAYGGANNLTPGLNWRPELDLMINNVLSGPGAPRYCATAALLCVRGWTRWTGTLTQVPMASILRPGSILDGTAYQAPATALQAPTPGDPALARFAAGPEATGTFTARSLADLRSGLAASPYQLVVETHGLAKPDLVDRQGRPTSALPTGTAHPVPVDATLNRYLPAGWRDYGATGAVISGDAAD